MKNDYVTFDSETLTPEQLAFLEAHERLHREAVLLNAQPPRPVFTSVDVSKYTA